MAEPSPVITSVGSTWLPYAMAGLALVALAVIARSRARSRESASLAEFLSIRGTVLLLIATMVGLLADAASEGDGVTAVDRPIWSWLVEHRSGTWTSVMEFISNAGSTVAMGLIALLVSVVLLFRAPNRGKGTLVVVVAAGAGAIIRIAKPLVGRVRPPAEFRLVLETNQSFPSGHALASAAIIGVVVVVLVPMIPSGRWRVVAVTAAAVFVLMVGVSRLYLGVHWSTDVLGGWLSGVGWLLLCLTVRTFWRRYPGVRHSIASGMQIQ
jgi:membrane-associated phospholipid phosphatase